MANEEHLALLRQGVDAWNEWRRKNPGIRPDLSGAHLHGMDLYGADLIEANLNGASFYKADLTEARLRGADLREASLSAGTKLPEADLRKASFCMARFFGVDLRKADLRKAHLEYVMLNKTDLTGADLRGCRVYGISAWDLTLDGATKQENLIITEPDQPEITVDNLEVAQFIYLLLHNEKIRRAIDTITTKAVLILGPFSPPERKAVLNALRQELRKRDHTPIVFDFDPPKSKNVTDTVKLLAQMARYVIVDLSDPNSAPYELGVISMLGLDSTPVVPLIAGEQRPFPMLADVLRKPWSTQLVRYRDLDDIRANLDEMLIKVAEAKVRELRGAAPGRTL